MSKLFLVLFWLGVIGLLVYEFLFGSLLFLNPIKLGIRSVKLNRAVVYTSNLYELNPIYDFVEDHMNKAEFAYGLKYNAPVHIYVATSAEEFGRWIPPWVGTHVGGLTLYIGNTIYINPEPIKKNNYNEEEFLKHELIHNLLIQNTALLANFVVLDHEWVTEGVAMHFGGPHYMNENEFRKMMRNNSLTFDDKSSKLFTNLDQKDYKFKMSVYQYFITFLIDRYGLSSFMIFLKQYLDSPSNYKLIFFEIYDKPIKLVVDEFKREYGVK